MMRHLRTKHMGVNLSKRKRVDDEEIEDPSTDTTEPTSSSNVAVNSQICVSNQIPGPSTSSDPVARPVQFQSNITRYIPKPVESHTSENLKNELIRIVTEWGLENKVAACNSDNAANIVGGVILYIVKIKLEAQNYTRKADQNVIEYFYEKISRCNRANMDDNETIRWVVRGLRNDRYRDYLGPLERYKRPPELLSYLISASEYIKDKNEKERNHELLTGQLQPNVFMSDMAESFFNAWIVEMKHPKHRTLLHEQNTKAFERIFEEAINQLSADDDTIDFVNNYGTCVESWAYRHRLHARINTNMHIERIHRTLKHIYLEGKKVKRLDKNRHKNSLEMSTNNVLKDGEGCWNVMASGHDDIYTVNKLKDS
ncbi:hypothetical protein AGLY_016378 [Aphis glycines]|uniref:Uncharacterized protein n=1 Tax=Aphis glycines TaxID=307491 RepID=A0A6G0SZV4_APHGL|nr:hypothetical protein AGLY_016378 [Aphis glycines]